MHIRLHAFLAVKFLNFSISPMIGLFWTFVCNFIYLIFNHLGHFFFYQLLKWHIGFNFEFPELIDVIVSAFFMLSPSSGAYKMWCQLMFGSLINYFICMANVWQISWFCSVVDIFFFSVLTSFAIFNIIV